MSKNHNEILSLFLVILLKRNATYYIQHKHIGLHSISLLKKANMWYQYFTRTMCVYVQVLFFDANVIFWCIDMSIMENICSISSFNLLSQEIVLKTFWYAFFPSGRWTFFHGLTHFWLFCLGEYTVKIIIRFDGVSQKY